MMSAIESIVRKRCARCLYGGHVKIIESFTLFKEQCARLICFAISPFSAHKALQMAVEWVDTKIGG